MNIKRIFAVGVLCLAVALGFMGLLPGTVAAGLSFLAAQQAAAFVGDTTETTDLTAAMKVIFGDSLINNVVTDSELSDIFQESGGIKTDQTTGGRYIETAQLFKLPAGVGSRATNGYIPVPRGPVIDNSQITLKKLMGSVEISGDVLKRVRTDEGAFVDWGAQVMPKLVEKLTNDVDRILLGYGSAIRARVNAATPALTLVVDSAFGIANYGGAVFQFQPNETIIASANANGSSPRSGVMIVDDVDHDNNAIVIATTPGLATSLANNDYLFEGDAADNSAGKDAMGLLGIVDNGSILPTFQAIARASYSGWRAQVIDAGTTFPGSKLTEEVLVYADIQAYQRGGGKPDMIVTSREGHSSYWKDIKGDRSINDPGGTYTGGKGDLSAILSGRKITMRVARKMPPALAFGIQKSTMHKWMLREFEWDDTTGSLFRQVTDNTGRKDAFYAYGTMHWETGCDDPQKNFRISGFAV